MKTSQTRINVTISLPANIQLDAREASFLREMAQFCSKHDMRGADACDRLDELLAKACIPAEAPGPIYGLFEED